MTSPLPARLCTLGALLFGLATLLPAPPAFADGKVFSRYLLQPTIPDQEALIAFRDGVETLAIETRFVAGSGPSTSAPADPSAADQSDFAWVVPIPGAGGPPEITAATPGLFPTLRSILQPRVNSDDSPGSLPLTVLGSLIILILCWARMRSLAEWCAVTIVLLVLVFVSLPTLGKARSSAAPLSVDGGVAVLDRSIVGSFDVTVIAPDTAGSTAGADAGANLRAWLTTNGYSLPASIEPVLSDYAAKGWVFVASRLRADAGTSDARVRLAPHPLIFKFKTSHPVYPLRLTGPGNGPLAVDLYVFGPGRAEAGGFRAVRCVTPEFPPAEQHPTGRRWPMSTPQIVHPQLRALIPAGSVATKLSATLSPEQMTTDANIRWASPSRIGAEIYTRDAALVSAMERAGVVLLAASFVLAIACGLSALAARRRAIGVLSVIAAAAVTGLAWYTSLPTAEVIRADRNGGWRNSYRYQSISAKLYDRAKSARAADPTWRPRVDWARDIVRTELDAEAHDDRRSGELPAWRAAIREEDSPFNYVVREGRSPDTVDFVWFDLYGQEIPSDIGPIE